MNRRIVLSATGSLPFLVANRRVLLAGYAMNLLTIPMELAGNWRDSAPQDVGVVVARMRIACLADVAMRSDHQPERLRVDNHMDGNPHIWLHAENPTTAWIVVDVGTRDWCKLCYQFGHELGHIVANSWELNARARNPSQWLEEALVEAFSLRGLARLATEWERSPPFPKDSAYSSAIRAYREQVLAPYRVIAREQGSDGGLAAWFRGQKAHLDTHGGVDAARGAVPTMLELLEGNSALVQDVGAMNRWPDRTGVPVADYLSRWQKSCADLGTPGELPRLLTGMLSNP